ncbi:MAG TPA: RidA family protein [Chloroflexota bacterium]|nr:RidA family protein [Chloroflexota bacterium]
MLTVHPTGDYRFLPGDGSRPFCRAVVAAPGFEIVRAQLQRPLEWRRGFDVVERHLAETGRDRSALCSVELRCREPYTPDAFDAFNAEYTAHLGGWGVFVDGLAATTRTNVAPDFAAPSEQVLFAFAYTVPAAGATSTFVLSGATEGAGVRPGETSPAALREKTADIVRELTARLDAIGQGWDATTQVAVYTTHDALAAVRAELVPLLGPAALDAVRWFFSRPPIVGLELEIDARRLRQELRFT